MPSLFKTAIVFGIVSAGAVQMWKCNKPSPWPASEDIDTAFNQPLEYTRKGYTAPPGLFTDAATSSLHNQKSTFELWDGTKGSPLDLMKDGLARSVKVLESPDSEWKENWSSSAKARIHTNPKLKVDGVAMFRMSATMNASVDTLVASLAHFSVVGSLDDSVMYTKAFNLPGDGHMLLAYTRVDAGLGLSNRDFADLVRWHRDSNGDVWQICMSYVAPLQVLPHQPGAIRGATMLWAVRLRPNVDDVAKTDMVILSQASVGGMLPLPLVNLLTGKVVVDGYVHKLGRLTASFEERGIAAKVIETAGVNLN